MNKIIKWFKDFFSIGSTKNKTLFDDVPTDDYEYNDLKKKREDELDRILEKIQKHGIETLSKEEKAFLNNMRK